MPKVQASNKATAWTNQKACYQSGWFKHDRSVCPGRRTPSPPRSPTAVILEIWLAQFEKLSQITKSQHGGDCTQCGQQRDKSLLGLVPWNRSKTHSPLSWKKLNPIVYITFSCRQRGPTKVWITNEKHTLKTCLHSVIEYVKDHIYTCSNGCFFKQMTHTKLLCDAAEIPLYPALSLEASLSLA